MANWSETGQLEAPVHNTSLEVSNAFRPETATDTTVANVSRSGTAV